MRDCLQGIRVLDLSQYLPGPYAAQILSDLGAEVVKVEPPAGDPMRRLGEIDEDGLTPAYKLINAGKTVVRLDLKSDDGKAAFGDLIRHSDVLVESYRPGTLDKLGFDLATLKTLNPRLVHVALSGYGQTGPYALKGGHDINYMALGGGLAGSGTAERPVMAYPPTADFAGGMQAALAALAALLRRVASGEGAFVDVSLMESVLAWQAMQLTETVRTDRHPTRGGGMLTGGLACYNIYRTAEGRFVSLGALEPKFWRAFCEAVGQAEWMDRQWEPRPQRALIAAVASLFAGAGIDYWQAKLVGVDCCLEVLHDPAEVLTHPQVEARNLVRQVDRTDPLVEVVFPAILNGREVADRPAVREVSLACLLPLWGDTAGG